MYKLIRHMLLGSLLLSSVAAAAELPRIAIKPAIIGENVSKYSRKHFDSQALLSEMELSLNNSRKFITLTRDKAKLAALREEQKFANSGLAKGNAAETGQLENANFLIIPNIQNFKFYRKTSNVPNLPNKYFRTDSGSLEVQAQVIDTSTGQLKASLYMKSHFGIKREMVNSKGGVPNSSYFSRMSKEVAAKMTDQLVDLVFPMKVVKVKDNQLTINRGKDGGLKKNMKLVLFKVEEELFDPDTGLSLGKDETYIGDVKVIRVKPKFSVVKILKLDSEEEVSVGDIIRKS